MRRSLAPESHDSTDTTPRTAMPTMNAPCRFAHSSASGTSTNARRACPSSRALSATKRKMGNSASEKSCGRSPQMIFETRTAAMRGAIAQSGFDWYRKTTREMKKVATATSAARRTEIASQSPAR